MKPSPVSTFPFNSPAPVKGLNTVDALAAMAPEYGLSLQNCIAAPTGVSLRQGYRRWATDLPAPITTLIPFNARQSGNSKLFAVCGTKIYDVTAGGSMSAATPVVTGLSSSSPYWQCASQSHGTGATNYLIACNGVDTPRLYDGSSWTTCSQSGSPSAPGQFSNNDNNGNPVNLASFVDVVLHQQRWWFVANNSTKAYYVPIASAGGALTVFDFGPVFPRGGYLHKLATWTIDSGDGTNALLVAFSNKGDCALFAGTNPATASTWSYVGTYALGAPVGRRCTTQLAGDLIYLSLDGMYPMSKYIQSARVDATSALTYYISPTITNLFSLYGSLPGFEAIVYPANSIVLLNIPQSTQTNNFQFCYHTVNQGWTQFTGWPAQCFTIYNDALYFGGTDFVALAFIGYTDGADIAGAGGDTIVATALTAFSAFNVPGKKHAKLVMPVLVTGQSNPSIQVGVNTDFNLSPIVGSATINPITGPVWNNAVWDNPNSVWVGSSTTKNEWSTPLCWEGEYLAFAMSFSANTETIWTNTSWIISQPGSVFG